MTCRCLASSRRVRSYVCVCVHCACPCIQFVFCSRNSVANLIMYSEEWKLFALSHSISRCEVIFGFFLFVSSLLFFIFWFRCHNLCLEFHSKVSQKCGIFLKRSLSLFLFGFSISGLAIENVWSMKETRAITRWHVSTTYTKWIAVLCSRFVFYDFHMQHITLNQ